VYEKMAEKMQLVANNGGTIQKMVGNWAKNKTTEYHVNRRKYGDAYNGTLGYKFSKRFIFPQVYKRLGLDKTMSEPGGCYVSAAPLSKKTFEYFQSLGIELQEVFGSSETTGPQTANLEGFGRLKPGTVGLTHKGIEEA
jgi:long-chain-fatty-acid--CoA ligase ACSBG